jgi:Nitrogen fixation protein NifW
MPIALPPDAADIPHDPEVVRVSRLHILQRFHDYTPADRVFVPLFAVTGGPPTPKE